MNITTLPVGMLQTNCYLLCHAGLCAIVDPGAAAQRIIDAVGTQTVCMILLTHAHFDHTGALQALHAQYPDAPIYVHENDSDNAHNMSHGNLIYTHTYREGDTLCLGELPIRVLHTPGHTPGSVCLLAENHLFAGDTLFAGACGRTDFEGGSLADMMASLRRLSHLDGEIAVYPGHGESTTIARERAYNYYMQEAMRV